MRAVRCPTGLLMLVVLLSAGCGGGGSSTDVAPAGLTERDESVVYAQQQEIIPNTPSSSGGLSRTVPLTRGAASLLGLCEQLLKHGSVQRLYVIALATGGKRALPILIF